MSPRGVRGLLIAVVAAAALPASAPAFTPDKSLAGSGIDRIPVGDRDVAGAGGVAVMPDGRTVLTGYAKQGDKTVGAIIRVTPAGDADPTFAADTSFPGTIFVNAVGPDPEDAGKVTVLQDGVLAADGSIYASGRIVDRPGEYEESGQAFVTHVLADGKLDVAFGTGGFAILGGQIAPQLLLAPDGGVLVLLGLDSPGTAAPATGVTKLTATGQRDMGYAGGGVAKLAAGDNDFFTASQMALDAQGRVVAAGAVLQSSSIAPGVARLTTAGTLDPSFGGKPVPGIGIVSAAAVDDGASSTKIDGLSPAVQSLAALAVAPDGKIIVAGRGTTNGADIALVGRVLASGKLDTSFGQKGYARFRGQKQADLRDRNYDTALTAVALDGSRIVVAGTQDSVADAVQIKQPVAPGSVTAKQSPDLLVAGLTSAGKLDPTAQVGGPVAGVAVYPVGAQRFARPRRMVLAGGTIVIAGRAIAVASGGEREPEKNPSDFLLVRLGKGTAPPPTGPAGPEEPGGACPVPSVKVRSAVLVGCFGNPKGGVSTAASGTVTMNGTRIALLNGSRLVVTPSKGTIKTATASGGAGVARLSAATPTGAVVQLSKGPVDFAVPLGGGGTRAVAAGPPDACKPIGQSIGTVSTQGVGNLLGFPLPGVAKVSTANGVTYIQVNVSLPKPAFVDATGCATLVTKASGGLQLDSLHVAVGTATLGPLKLGKVSIDYTGSADTWKGTLMLTLPLPRDVDIKGDITFQSGDFAAANVGVEFPVAPIILPPTIGLKGVSAGVQIKPFTKITGGVHLTAGPSFLGSAAVDANLTGTISFPGKPYAVAIDITGEVRVVSIPLATAQVHYDTGGTFFVKAHAGFDAFVADINVDVLGYISGPHFFIEGDARLCAAGFCGGSSALISEKGAAACGGLVTPVKDLAIGVFIKWTNPFIPDELFFHCDLTSYRTVIAKTRLAPQAPVASDAFTRQAGTGRTVTVAPGTRTLELKASGTQTPLVAVVAPDGTRTEGPTRSYDLPLRASQVVRAGAVTIMAVRAKTASYIRVDNPAPGVWKVESQLGTAPITQLAQSVPLPAPKVTAKVGGTGRARTVDYAYTPAPGESVSVVEQGGRLEHPIGELRSGRRALRFAPGDGPAGRRSIVARVTQDGLPRKSIVLASYIAPGPDVPGKPRGVKLRAAGGSAVRATWRAVPRAASYRVTFRLKDGHAATVIVKASVRPSARTTAFLPKKGGRVTVVAVSRAALAGQKSVGVLKPAVPKRTPVKRRA